MKKRLFSGAATALITPFDEKGAVDYEGFCRLIEFQIKNGISALVIAGTTGEASTLSFDEFSMMIAKANEVIRHRVPLIAGSGSNNTAKALKWSLEAQKRGADAILSVTPYYNKTTQEGLIRHYHTIADRIDIPMILYHVPSRTGMTMIADTVATLADHKMIIGLKEASGNLSYAADVVYRCSDLSLYSGNDDQILPYLSLGGDGVISVLSNIAPKEVQNICKYFEEGEITRATELQLRLIPLIRLIFSTVNPIPIKKAMEILGLPAGNPRLPLVECDEETTACLRECLRGLGF